RYTILLDHQPYNLEQAEKAGVDFQFSGHTHHGQVWPISWITERIYEDAFGPYQRGNTRYYVSSGIGIWGGKFRIGTQSEYVVAKLNTKR
ncbi:MAG: metallophosphoesterase, partial [Prevotella sp.]|nr:metallophosphoesterase [Prevotella sp.]